MQKQFKLYAFFGLIASGKSTLAAAWADKIGANYYNSDVIRKELAGLLPQNEQKSKFNQGIYTAEFSQKTYSALLEKAAAQLGLGKAVVLDASYQEKAERARVKDLADRFGCPANFVQCICPEELMKERMEIRSKDPKAVSDGRWEIYLKQRERFRPPDELGPQELFKINTNKPVTDLLEDLAELLLTDPN